ncbi:NmrA-like family protein [Microthyrium microscopicum]|uniref:NmrA-like family protein n=1 Tax=Microthyrium microscopicum TaxID=703497 RepID=A0A6A6UQ37_9PEZI|nr:NmrA-like family protein [Microthyrium microscopicum]
MSSAKPLLVVLGATGNQGGSVIAHFLSVSPSSYALRAVTRDPSSAKATSLASQGVEVVVGDFDDPKSLDKAFDGASIIFAATDFVQLMLSASLRERAAATGEPPGFYIRDYEAQQNKNIIDAAAKVTTLDRFIFSGLPNVNKLSEGKYAHVYYCDSKALAEEYGKAKYPQLWEKTSVFYAGFFLENLIGEDGAFRPTLNKSKDTLIAQKGEPLTTVLFPWYSAVQDTGPFVAALIHAAPGQKLLGVNQWLSLQDIYKIMAHTMGKAIRFVDSTPTISIGDPEFQRAHKGLIGFSVEFGYDGSKVDKTVLRPEELNKSIRLPSVEDWIKQQDWDNILQCE